MYKQFSNVSIKSNESTNSSAASSINEISNIQTTISSELCKQVSVDLMDVMCSLPPQTNVDEQPENVLNNNLPKPWFEFGNDLLVPNAVEATESIQDLGNTATISDGLFGAIFNNLM